MEALLNLLPRKWRTSLVIYRRNRNMIDRSSVALPLASLLASYLALYLASYLASYLALPVGRNRNAAYSQHLPMAAILLLNIVYALRDLLNGIFENKVVSPL
jgi:hypothetical protein